jgi:hypothetical protein
MSLPYITLAEDMLYENMKDRITEIILFIPQQRLEDTQR